MAFCSYHFAAIDEHTHAVQAKILQVFFVDAIRHVLVSEIRQPAQCAALDGDGFQEHHGRGDPFKGVQLHQRNVMRQSQVECGDQAHIVVERQPTNDLVLPINANRLPVAAYVF